MTKAIRTAINGPKLSAADPATTSASRTSSVAYATEEMASEAKAPSPIKTETRSSCS